MRTFEQYQEEQARLLALCGEIERMADDFASTRSTLESELEPEPSAAQPGTVATMLAEARRRLTASTIEVGVFGNVKRGKSTLVNALVGFPVSSMSVTPETAVPVWIESGEYRSFVVREDGTVEDVADAATAAEMATQRHTRKDSRSRIVRVVQRLPIDWLPEGLRLVDTPGLDDPNDAALYEELTLAELDRVAAAVFVFCSPPGPAGEEVRLLRALGERGVDKAFLVCNFYRDHWSDFTIRQDMAEYIEAVVAEGADGGVQREDVRVYPVSAKDGFSATQSEAPEEFVASGVEAIRADLERFLTADALPRLLSAATQRIRSARDVLLDAVIERRSILTDPRALESVRAERAKEVAAGSARLSELVDETHSAANDLEKQMVEVMAEPYRSALQSLTAASTVDDLQQLEHQLRLRLETAASRASVKFSQSTTIHEERVRRRLFDAFGVAERLNRATAITPEWSGLADDSSLVLSASMSPDWATAGAAGAATAVGGTLIGGSLAGGVGVALLAAGPIGWIIGAAAGGALGLLAGTAGGAIATRRSLSEADRTAAKSALTSRLDLATDKARSTVRSWSANVARWLTDDADRFLAEGKANLERVETILRDERGRQSALQQANAMNDRLATLIWR